MLASFAGQRETTAEVAIDSIVTRTADGWRWELDSSPLTTGRVLWRTTNGMRLLTLLSVMVDKQVVESWCVLYDGAMLAAHEGPGGEPASVVTERLAELVAGAFGRTAFLAVPRERFLNGINREDEATLASERNSTLIATFIEDQLAVRPPITQAEVDGLKRRLGLTDQAEE